MDGSRKPGDRAEAWRLLLEFFADPSDRPMEFEELCAAHPHLADELRQQFVELLESARSLDRSQDHASVGEKLGATLGAPVEPGVDLPAGPDETGSTPTLHERLVAEGPRGARYEVRGQIARGGMGLVLEVWDRDLRRSLAMKVVGGSPDSSGPRLDLRTVSRFLEEAQITGQLQHPGIVPVHELGMGEDERAYFTMPLVRGRELKELLPLAREEREGWSLRRALGVLVKVCEAVGFAHSKGVLHRDLKPSNVMVGRFGETYVMDWGLARVMGRQDTHDIRLRRAGEESTLVSVDREGTPGTHASPLLTMDGDVVGTPAYMPPEQARGRIEELGPHSDVYSIGAMLYHLLTGQMPYVAPGTRSSPQAVLARVLAGPPADVLEVEPGTPLELAEICARAMAREPSERYASALELSQDLEAWLGGRPVTAHGSSPSYLLRLAYRRNRPVFLTAAAALVAALAWGGIYLQQTRAAFERQKELTAAAESAEARTQRVSDRILVQVLVDEAASLAPGAAGAAADMRRWLEQADDVLTRRERYRVDLAAEPTRDDLQQLEAGLDRLGGLRPAVARRLELASTLRERTVEAHRDLWSEVADDVQALPRYAGLELEPQVGLVPLRRDPDSGLWEFWLDLSGDAPRIGEGGALELAEESAVVLVLIPPGDDPEGEPAFFLGKHEVTQAQWDRVMGPGFPPFAVVLTEPGAQDMVGPLHPVESVSWYDAAEFTRRLGCELPDEYAWERALRAGSTTTYWWGDHPYEAEGLENLFDQAAAHLSIGVAIAPWDDGYVVHAPIGSFEPNPYGLYDMAGNVAEWCSNWYRDDEPPDSAARRRSFRGGSWYTSPGYDDGQRVQHGAPYSTFRQADNPRGLNQTRGVRLARPLGAADRS